jgi:hypothetical protein
MLCGARTAFGVSHQRAALVDAKCIVQCLRSAATPRRATWRHSTRDSFTRAPR